MLENGCQNMSCHCPPNIINNVFIRKTYVRHPHVLVTILVRPTYILICLELSRTKLKTKSELDNMVMLKIHGNPCSSERTNQNMLT